MSSDCNLNVNDSSAKTDDIDTDSTIIKQEIQNENNELDTARKTKYELSDMEFNLDQYQSLKEKYIGLQDDYRILLGENLLLSDYNLNCGNNDDTLDSLNKVNEELKAEIENISKELKQTMKENKRLAEDNEEFRSNTETPSSQNNKLSEAFHKTIDRLEKEINDKKQETQQALEKLEAHDQAAKKAITTLQKDLSGKVEKATKLNEQLLKEKDSCIVKISKLETELDDLKKKRKEDEKKINETQTEFDRMQVLGRGKDSDNNKLQINLEECKTEILKLKKNIKIQKGEAEGGDMKTKWAQNKLKQELEAHKETKKQLASISSKLNEAKEEGNQLRKSCQEMIQKYQNSEEMESVRLNLEIKEYESNLKSKDQEISTQKEANRLNIKALDALKDEFRKVSTESNELKKQVFFLVNDNTQLEKQTGILKQDKAELKDEVEALKDHLKNYDQLQVTIKNLQIDIESLRLSENTLKHQLQEVEAEHEQSNDKHQRLLQYSSKLTENNVVSKSLASQLQQQLNEALQHQKETENKARERDIETTQKNATSDEIRQNLASENEELQKVLEQKANTLQELTNNITETQEQIKLNKRKSHSQIKDLQRQLRQATSKIEQLESGSSSTSQSTNGSKIDNLSRSSSSSSLEKVGEQASTDCSNFSTSPKLQQNVPSFQNQNLNGVMMPSDHSIVQPSRANRNNEFAEVEINKKMLVERICKLQRSLAKKSEKIEFMDEHINSLTEEIQKKSRIIQFYISQEDPGTISSEKSDKNKADLSRRGGIMASVYSSNIADKAMTLELSLTINSKLQAVLEDTLLKNIMLKENLNTLGEEIARLQKKKTTTESKTQTTTEAANS